MLLAIKRRAGSHRWAKPELSDIGSGLNGGMTSLPGNIACGFVAFGPLGAAAQGNGVGVALLAAAVGGGVFTAVCRTRGLLAGGSMSFALVVASLLTTLMQRGFLQPGVAGFPTALVVVALLTLVTGLCEVGLAASGLGQLVTMLPYPVVSGIRNGAALLMILLQLRPMLGVVVDDGALRWAHPAALAVSVVTLGLMLRPVRQLRPVPPAVIAVLAGTGVHYLIRALVVTRGGADLLGPQLSVPASGAQHLRALADGWAGLPGLPPEMLATLLLPAALTVAVVSALETLVGASVMQDISGEQASSRADLLALAAANVASGVCGTLPVTGGSQASMAVWGAGGRSKLAGWSRAAVLGAAVLLAGPVIGFLPTAALAGLVVSNGLQVFDQELFRLGRTALSPGSRGRLEMIGNLLVTATVIGAAMAFSLVAAVLTGLLLSAALFIVTMSGTAVRRRYRNPGSRSRTVRSEEETEALMRHGSEIEVVELQGALFFGSADQLVREVDAAWKGGARCVVLDLRRLSQVDLSGARRLLQVATRHWERGAFLAFAGFQPGSPVWAYYDRLDFRSKLRADRTFSTLEEALAGAERVVLAAHGVAERSAYPAATDVLRRLGFPDQEASALLHYAPEHSFDAGAAIIKAGEEADIVYILVEGEVAVSLPPGADGLRTRLATLTAGTLFGEMALLSGSPRSADVTALTPVRCMGLDVATLAQLRQARPELAYQVMAAIAGQLASNMLMANVALRSAGE